MLPDAAFHKLSSMEGLPAVLAGFAQKFDVAAFLWLLLQRLARVRPGYKCILLQVPFPHHVIEHQ